MQFIGSVMLYLEWTGCNWCTELFQLYSWTETWSIWDRFRRSSLSILIYIYIYYQHLNTNNRLIMTWLGKPTVISLDTSHKLTSHKPTVTSHKPLSTQVLDFKFLFSLLVWLVGGRLAFSEYIIYSKCFEMAQISNEKLRK